MRAAIIGSRDRDSADDRAKIINLVDSLSSDTIVVSGGCRGVDSWAEKAAKSRGLDRMIFRPKLRRDMTRSEIVEEYYRRNRKIIDNADIVYAMTSNKRKGGTGYTVNYALSKGKIVNLL